MKRMNIKGQMSLEYIVKLIIVTVVIMVVIGMIQKFEGDAVEDWREINPEEEEEDLRGVVIDGPFSPKDMASFVVTCFKNTMGADDNRVCFVLKGTYTGTSNPADALDDIKSNIEDPIIRDRFFIEVDGDMDHTLYSISYELKGSKIVLE